jgi:fructosamine-3-kinase
MLKLVARRWNFILTKSFPVAPDDLTAEWLRSVTHLPVENFSVSSLGEGVGVLGSVNRIHLQAQGGPATLIVKFSTRVAENRAVALTYDMYRREINFYRELAAAVPIRTPRCLAAEYDDDSDDFVLLLEDLADCRQGDQVAGAGLAEAEAVVDTLAALHAATWQQSLAGPWQQSLAGPWQQSLAGVPSHNIPAQRTGIAEGLRQGWPVVTSRFPELISAQARECVPDLADQIGQLISLLTADKQCLVHADVRLDNILFDGDTPVLVDWQSACLCSGEQDLAYFLTQSLPDALRDEHLDQLIQRYHQALCAGGVREHSLSDCRERFRIAALYLLAWAVLIAGTLDMGNERGLALARALLSRSLNSVEALDGFALLR